MARRLFILIFAFGLVLSKPNTAPVRHFDGKSFQNPRNDRSSVRSKAIKTQDLSPARTPATKLELAEIKEPLTEPLKEPLLRMTDHVPATKPNPWNNRQFSIEPNDVVVFVGSENVVTEQRVGVMESLLAAHWNQQTPRFRHMGWEGDTVYRQNRMESWGSWRENLEGAAATVVVAWFGQIEAFDSSKSDEDFSRSYSQMLDEFILRTPRIVLIGPALFEKPSDPRVPDNTSRNTRLKRINDVVRRLATDRGFVFIDLFELIPAGGNRAEPYMRDGIHFSENGWARVARRIVRQLGVGDARIPEGLQSAIVEKNRLWFDTWRCMNWAFAFGDRTTQPFAGGAAGRPRFVDELKKYQPLLAHADATVHAIASGKPAPSPLLASPDRSDPPAPTPEEEMSRFKMREGFEVSLFADEKLGVIRPLQIRWDERGRLWVACTPTYPQLQPGEQGSDFILVLEDKDGDGRADSSFRFAENLTLPMGFEFAPQDVGGGIYLCESTRLLHLPDENGDGKADGRKVLMSGFGTGDTHQNANSLRWGADGCLWFSQGYHIWSYVETPSGVSELNRSGLWRLNPRTLRLDSFLNESAAGLNCWGTAFDDYGQVFHGSGADTTIWHTAPATIPTIHPLNLGTGIAGSRGKSMEPEFLGSSHLPDELRGVLLKSTYYTSQIQLYRLRDDGAGFASEAIGDLMASSGSEFRPVETRVGPDGALYVCDWLNSVIGHYQASYRDPRRDRSHGRIWRVTAKERPLVKKPELFGLSATQLIEHLRSDERWERDVAKFALYRMPRGEVLPAIIHASDPENGRTPESARFLYELSGVFAAHELPRPSLIAKFLASEDFRWRAWGARLTGVWAGSGGDVLEFLRQAVVDEHPRVRMEGVVACAWVPAQTATEALKLATLVLDQSLDSSINHALTQCIHALAPYWQPALAEGRLDFGSRYHALAKVLTTVGDTRAVARIRELVESKGVSGSAREGLLAVLVETGSPLDVAFAITNAPDSRVVMDALIASAFRKKDAGYGVVISTLINSPFAMGRIAGCRVAAAWGNDFGNKAKIRQIAFGDDYELNERTAAIGAMAKVGAKESLVELLPILDSPHAGLRNAALEALAPLDTERVAARIVKLLSEAKSDIDVGGLLQPIFRLKNGAPILAKAATDLSLSASGAKLALQWLAKAGRDDRGLVDTLKRSAGVSGVRVEYQPDLVASWVATARSRGNEKRGAEIFHQAELSCLACHRVGNEGGVQEGPPLAPDLSAIGRAMTPELIVESVFWPKRQVKEGFMLTQVTTRDGRDLQGYKVAESPNELRLRQFDGALVSIQKPEIATRSDAGTLMPEGLTDGLTSEQRDDLLQFLFQLGRNP